MNRGLARRRIFDNDEDCIELLVRLDEVGSRYRIEIHGYALMPNHFHLLLRSRGALLSRAMAVLSSRYTRTYNRRHDRDGPLFRGRFRNRLIEDEDYLTDVLAYIHLNPVKGGLVRRPDDLCWTSHRAYIGLDSRPDWLRCDEMLTRFGDAENLDSHMRALHRGAEHWPADLALDLEGIWAAYGRSSGASEAGGTSVRLEWGGAKESGAILRKIEALTGYGRDELLDVRRGRGANPARRFAIWALSRDPRFSHADIAHVMGASTNQVSLVLSRLRRRTSFPIDSWMERWREGEKNDK